MWKSDSSRDSPTTNHIGCFSHSDVKTAAQKSSFDRQRSDTATAKHLCNNCVVQAPYCLTVGIDRSFPLPPSLLVKQKPPPSSSDANSSSLSSSTPFSLSTGGGASQFHCINNNGSVEKTVEWVNNVQLADSFLGHRTPSSMFNKDSPSGSNRSSTSSSNSSGYLGSTNQVNHPSPSGRQSRLSGQSYESGVSSLSSSHYSYLSGYSSSQSSLDPSLEQNIGHSNAVGINDLHQQGLKEPEILRAWLNDLHLLECYPLFLQAGYDMPTITRMTPEDLTAIGITQPVVRKRLTSEISKLQICDGIPNYTPNSLMEWLQCLRLEQYHNILTNDGYDDLDRITDIIWEDLEEIGIHKLGHQKKIMLAIDRLKKLNNSTRRMSSMDGPYNSTTDPPASASVMPTILEKVPPSTLFTVNPSRPTDDGRRVRRTLSGDSLTFSPSSREAHPDSGDRGTQIATEIIHLRPQTGVPPPQPEVVTIHVNHVTRSWAGSAADRCDSRDSCNQVKYESFHGSPFKDFQCLRNKTDGSSETTPTNDRGLASSDETMSASGMVKLRPQVAAKPKVEQQMRRVSGGCADAMGVDSNTPLQRHSSYRRYDQRERLAAETSRENDKQELPRPASAGVSYRSAPCTPAHVPAPTTTTCQGRTKRTTPPPPPKRTNSMRDDVVVKTEFEIHEMKPHSSVSRVESEKPPMEQQSKNSFKFNVVVSSKTDHQPRSSSTEMNVDGLCGDVTAKQTESKMNRSYEKAHHQWKESSTSELISPQKMRTVLQSASAHASNSSDCNTLPFANENIGTIKQRVGNKPATTISQNSTEKKEIVMKREEITLSPISNTNQKKRPTPMQKPKKSNAELEAADRSGRTESEEKADDIFNDIDNLFQGLSQELDEMLTFQG